ncbi:MAG TPA: hypothetical protein PKH81_09385, partial [Treponemataceae bacterium]|nr:hypothetical protein [Treponemataceae bacterium]
MRVKFYLIVLLAGLASCSSEKKKPVSIQSWITTPDRTKQLTQQPDLVFGSEAGTGLTIEVDTSRTYQSIDGFGFALT